MAVSTIEKTSVNHKGFDASVEITSYTQANPYVAPSDGFARIILASTRGTAMNLYVDGQTVAVLTTPSNADVVASQIASFPGYKGQEIFARTSAGSGQNRAFFNAYTY